MVPRCWIRFTSQPGQVVRLAQPGNRGPVVRQASSLCGATAEQEKFEGKHEQPSDFAVRKRAFCLPLEKEDTVSLVQLDLLTPPQKQLSLHPVQIGLVNRVVGSMNSKQ